MAMPPAKIGRPRDTTQDKRVKELREKGKLKWREIAAVMKRDVKTVYERYKSLVGDS